MEKVDLIVDGQHVKVSPGMAKILIELGRMHAKKMEAFAKAMQEWLSENRDLG